jgi:soluble lytic murein transglycosylase
VIQAQAAYWLGRSAAALGNQALAAEWYQRAADHHIAYYGQLAAQELGSAYRPAPPPPPADAGQRARFENKELVRVAHMLIEVGATAELGPFLIRLADLADGPAEVGLVADLAAASGRPHLVAQVGRFAAYYGHVNEAAAFPVPDLSSLVRPPPGEPEAALLLGVARQESVFNPWVASHAGAQGMLQLIPRTAYLMARALGLPYNRGLLTGDPDYNIRLGSHYLKTLLARYDGSTALAVAAYNAGPRRVDEWLRLHGDPRRGDRYDLIDWIELIPFDETRNYVQRVLEGRGMYRRRLADSQLALVHFSPVNGPLDPLPAPLLKPREEARQIMLAALLARAPIPHLKPIDGSVILLPAGFELPPLPTLKPTDGLELVAGSGGRPSPPSADPAPQS